MFTNKTLQGADVPPAFLAVAWYYWPWLLAWGAVHYVALFPLLHIYALFSLLAGWFVAFMMSSRREEPRLQNLWGYTGRLLTGFMRASAGRLATRQAVATRAPHLAAALNHVAARDLAPVVAVEGDEFIRTRQGLRLALEVDLTSLDSYDASGQADLCAGLATIVRSRRPKQWIELKLKSRAVYGAAVMDDLRGMIAPRARMYTEELAEMAARDLADLDEQMRSRFVGDLRGYIVVGAAPSTTDDERDEVATLRQTAATVKSALDGLGLGGRVVEGAELEALVFVPTVLHEGLRYCQTDCGYAASLALLLPDDETSPGHLKPLIEALSCPFDLAIHVVGLDRLKEKKRFKVRRRFEQEDDEGNAGQGVALARSRRAGVVQWGLYLTVWGDSPREAMGRLLQARDKMEVEMNAEVARMRGHQAPGLYATLAHGVNYADRRWRVDTNTIGNCFPYLRFNPGTEDGPPIAFAGNQLVRLNLSNEDHRTGIANVIALSGGGKTVLALKMTKWKLYQRGRATILERTGDPSKGLPSHYAALCRAAGGDMVYVGGERSAALNVWEDLGEPDIIGAHEIILGEPGAPFPKLWRSLVGQGVRAVRASCAAPLEEDFWCWLVAESRATERAEKERDILREMAATLEAYVGQGEFAHIFNRRSTVAWGSHLLVFNSQATPDHLQPILIYLVTAAINARGIRAGEVPPLTVLDEGWKVAEFEAGQKAIQEQGKRGRQTAVELLFLTQAVRDMKKAGLVDLLDNGSVIILLRLVDNTGSAVDDVTVGFGLTAKEKETVKGLKTFRTQPYYNGKAQAFIMRECRSQSRTVRHAVEIPTNKDEGLMFLSDPVPLVWMRERLIEEHGSVLAGVKAMRAALGRDATPRHNLVAAAEEIAHSLDASTSVAPLDAEGVAP